MESLPSVEASLTSSLRTLATTTSLECGQGLVCLSVSLSVCDCVILSHSLPILLVCVCVVYPSMNICMPTDLLCAGFSSCCTFYI
jgi:hypothetical protein